LHLTLKVSAILAAALFASAAEAAELPDGTYSCELYSGGMIMHLGEIEIAGNRYRGPAYDGAFEGSYDFEVTDAGTINWGGPLGGFDLDGQTVVSTVLTDAGGNRTGFDVTIQLESGNFSTVSCYPQ
jgi:hypothetical protein